jgi:hypothetical protein
VLVLVLVLVLALERYARVFGAQLVDRVGHRGDAREYARDQQALGKLDLEALLEREHHSDARVGGHTRGVQVGVARDRADVERDAPMVGDDPADVRVEAGAHGVCIGTARLHLSSASTNVQAG